MESGTSDLEHYSILQSMRKINPVLLLFLVTLILQVNAILNGSVLSGIVGTFKLRKHVHYEHVSLLFLIFTNQYDLFYPLLTDLNINSLLFFYLELQFYIC